MGKGVFANGMEIAHRAGDGKVTAAFPDVCLSPPPPPTGPVPVPYPNTSFAGDLKSGSTTVKIGGKPLALAGKSFYASSPLGNEAATRNFGGSVLTHTITGKTYFQAHSMDVAVEGKSVCRHLDITTSNHASYPGSTPPFPNAEQQAMAEQAIKDKKCACCGGPQHADGEDMHRDEWYEDSIRTHYEEQIANRRLGLDALRKKLAQAKSGGDGAAILGAQQALAAKAAEIKQSTKLRDAALGKLKNLSSQAVAPKTCACPPVAPSPPCDVFYKQPPTKKRRDAQHKKIDSQWASFKKSQLAKAPAQRIVPLRDMGPNDQVNHLTPKKAGGCPLGPGNLTLDRALCSACKQIEAGFTDLQKLG